MVSRRKILSRSHDDLNMDYAPEDEEDVWFQKEKLYKDHVQEVLDKWTQIDDEIWAKVICFERNRRVAKAYARAPVLTINGSDDGFDGYRIGLLGFDNPLRDTKTEDVRRQVGQGVKIKMDDAGNILIKRVSKSNAYVKETGGAEDNSLSAEALRLPNGVLEPDKPIKLFDMKKFQQNVSKELKRSYPDRRKLEFQCISAVAFVRNENDILDCPCWVIIINIVAMDMLKSKLPPVGKRSTSQDSRGRDRLTDEDPYSVPGSGSGASSRDRRVLPSDRPPKLPPRDATHMPKYPIPKPDYDEVSDENRFRIPHLQSSRKKTSTFFDDPYYCGMKAHTPNFATRGGAAGGVSKTSPPTNSSSSPNSSPPESIYVKSWMVGNAGASYNTPSSSQAPMSASHQIYSRSHHHHHMAPPKGTHKQQQQPQESIYNSAVQGWRSLPTKITDDRQKHLYARVGRLTLPRIFNTIRIKKFQWPGKWKWPSTSSQR
ncbi:hypothetical protein CHUAL_001632 [Chamberlinius hualienensis]